MLTLIDISSVKQAEADLRLMSKVFVDGVDPKWVEDLEGRIIEVNQETERAYGWSSSELLDSPA